MVEGPYFLGELLRAKQQRVVVSVYAHADDPDVHCTGYVLDATNEGVTLEHLTPDGAPDGRALLQMDEIFHVDVDGRYERKIGFLASHYDELFSPRA